MTKGTRPPTLPDDLWRDVYPLLRDNVGVGKPLSVKQVADEVGVSSPSVSAWINDKGRPNSYNLLQVLQIIGRRPETGALELAKRITGVSADTLTEADKAARQLAELDGLSEDEAWLLMRKVVGGNPESLYSAARHILDARRREHHRDRHSDRAEQLPGSNVPVSAIKTR